LNCFSKARNLNNTSVVQFLINPAHRV